MVGDLIDVAVGACNGQRFAVLTEGAEVIDILAEFVGGIAAGGRTAHAEDGGASGDVADDKFDLGFMVCKVWKGYEIADALGQGNMEGKGECQREDDLFGKHINS